MPSLSFLSALRDHDEEVIEKTQNEDRECVECKKIFNLTSGEIDFFVQHELETPKRCKPCRQVRKEGFSVKQEAEQPTTNQIICNNCNRVSTVPFTPIANRPVYCPVCWNGVKNTPHK
jgi:CxxC-x17-CxxC domain-containing protein